MLQLRATAAAIEVTQRKDAKCCCFCYCRVFCVTCFDAVSTFSASLFLYRCALHMVYIIHWVVSIRNGKEVEDEGWFE